ncbi:hypothetical protein [Parasphingorhabdus sp.]|uniref:hypothetical protein n=1 Tax=Parasphingorhabdus sp. TaxID=2709688 RepID=UPI003A90D3BA
MPIELPFAVVPLVLGTVATGNEVAATNPATHLGQFRYIGATWKSSGASNVWVRGDFGSAKAIDFISMIGANALPGTKIRIRLGDSQVAVDGASASYDSGAIDFISPSITRADGLYHSHLELPSVQTRRWWRIDITSHTGDFEVSKLIMGQKIKPTRFYNKDFEFGIQDTGQVDINRDGVIHEIPGKILRTLQFTLGWMTTDEYETKFRPLTEAMGVRGMTFWCFDPQANAYRQSKTYFGVFKVAPFASGGIKPGNYSQEFQILSVI